MRDIEYMTEPFLNRKGIRIQLFSHEQLESLHSKVYKNYYGYNMDEEYAVYDAVNELVKQEHIPLPELSI